MLTSDFDLGLHCANQNDLPFFIGSVQFLDIIDEVQSEVDVLLEQGVNKIIALGHAGIDKDMEIATKVRGVDIVVGGHSDTFLYTGK